MTPAITLSGINKAVANLEYKNARTYKYKYIHFILSHYQSDAAIKTITAIAEDIIIRHVWDLADDMDHRSKRRNLISLRSSVNNDLKQLFQADKNPEGIVIGPSNIFEMSEDAKSRLLNSFTNSIKADGDVDLNKVSEILKAISDFLSEIDQDSEKTDEKDVLEKIKTILKRLSASIFDDEDNEDEDTKTIELDPDEEIEEVDLDDDEDIETIELDPDEDIEDVDMDDEDMETIELEDDEDIEEVEIDGDEDIETIELDPDEDIEDVDMDDEDMETIELEDDEDIETVEIDEDAPPSGGLSVPDDDDSFKLDEEMDLTDKKRLSEQFDSYLGAMEKFYNQYMRVPAGKYIVGAKHPKRNDIPEQTFYTPEIYMGKFPVTTALFDIFIQKTGYVTTAEKLGYGTVYYGRYQRIVNPKTGRAKSVWHATYTKKMVEGACWYQPFGPGSNLHNKKGHPVVQVSVEDAIMFASWIGKRLPSEFEWETCARTLKGHVLPWGDHWQEESCNIETTGVADTTEVNTYSELENELGIADTMGNVMEWTTDEYRPTFLGSEKAAYAIAKGGSFISDNQIRLCSRFMFKPDFTSNIIGFRCVAD